MPSIRLGDTDSNTSHYCLRTARLVVESPEVDRHVKATTDYCEPASMVAIVSHWCRGIVITMVALGESGRW
jgi:hypothetical protein